MAIAPERTEIGIRRHFTTEGTHPYDTVTWERRDARITNFKDGTVAFEQLGVEVPSTWSVNATNILAQKYFRGALGSPERETSLKQVADRVVDTITAWGLKDGYFVDGAEARIFSDELKYLIIHQRAAFNSPVWFNIGVKNTPQQASACQPYDALVSTPEGLIPIGRLVENNAVGTKVYDAHGLTRIVAVKANGRKQVLRIHTKAGLRLDVTPDHLVWRSGPGSGAFVQAGELRPDDQLTWHRTEAFGESEITSGEIAEAALAGWLQSDGFVGQYKGTNRSLIIEPMTVTPAEHDWVLDALDRVFPDVHRHIRSVPTDDADLDCKRIRLYGKPLADFVDRWNLRPRRLEMEVPERLFTAPLPVVAAYLRSLFQAEGYVSFRERTAFVGFDMISERVVRGAQALLLRFGIFSRVGFKADSRADRQGCWHLSIQNLGDRIAFADEIGFIDPRKELLLEASFELEGGAARPTKRLQIDHIENLGERDVYDIQTESGEYLSSNLRVHNCFILAVEDQMKSILNWYVEEGTIFKGGSGSGINLSRIRSSYEPLEGGGTASGPVSFMRGADASAGTIKCLHADTEITTRRGVIPIRAVRPGDDVLTRFGYKAVEAVHDNGMRPLVRVRTDLGDEIVCTRQHRFRVRGQDGESWREAGQLRPDDHVMLDLDCARHGWLHPLVGVGAGHHREIVHQLPDRLDEGFAMWLGWVCGDGSVTTVPNAEFVTVQIGDEDETLIGRYMALTRGVFGPDLHFYVDRHADRPDASASVHFSSGQVIRFLERNGLRKSCAGELAVPDAIKASPGTVRAAFLAGLFEADGHLGNGYAWLSSVSQVLARDVHRLLLSIGIPSKVSRIDDRSGAYGEKPIYTVRIVGCEGVRRFAKVVGFVSDRKHHLLEQAVARKSASPFETQWVLPHVRDELDAIWLSTNDQRLRRAIAPYCRYKLPRAMSLLRARELVERFPDELGASPLAEFALGDDYYQKVTVEPAGDGPTFDLTIEDVHEYLVNSIITHNSGGKTRRAAKMVILNVDHPDIEDFIWCKALEERKARALRQAGFDMDLDGRDSHSIQYQNANNSVRVSDDFMQAVLDDADWDLVAVTTNEVIKTVKARELFRQISQAAWECADPGMQFDTTINRWHTAASTGRINGSNPCCFVGETLVETSEGFVPFDLLEKRAEAGHDLPLARSFDRTTGALVWRPIRHVWVAGHTAELIEVATETGLTLRCTPDHRFLTSAGEYVEARQLVVGTELRVAGNGRDGVCSIGRVLLADAVPVYDLEVIDTHNLAVRNDGPFERDAVVVANSEYMHLDNSACNLASLNLLTFLADNDDDIFDTEGFKSAVDVVFTAQEILVGNADYPTEKIGDTSRRFRQLGLGYANLGALLMALGLPYDSDEGRAWAGAITALMTGEAYATSGRTAARMGPFAGYTDNAEHMNRVLRMHRDEVAKIDEELVPPELLSAAQEVWDAAVANGEQHGIRNSQATVLAPTGCLVGGTLIPTERGLVRLRSLGDTEGQQWQDLGIEVNTDEGSRRATRFYVNGLEPVVTVDTERGYRVQGTPQHRIKVVDPGTGEWLWRRFGDLVPGELVPLALDQLIGEPQHVPLPPAPEAYWTSEHNLSVPRAVTPELAELVGYFMGDGSLHSRGLRFCVTDGDFDVVDRLEWLAKRALGLPVHTEQAEGNVTVRLDSVRLTLWWEACGFAKRVPVGGHVGKGYVPHIPDAILHSNDWSVYAAFLRGLYEADGTVTDGCPTWSTTSFEFARDVQTLLLAIGLPTTRGIETERTGWGTNPLSVLRLLNLSFCDRFQELIGFMSGRKGLAVQEGRTKQAARKDHIPVTRALIERLAPLGHSLRDALLLELRRDGAVTRRIAQRLFDDTEDCELAHLLSFFYDRVAAAELGDDEFTYDVSVPDNVTYLANGFISHNTIGLLMDCDTTGVEPDLGLVKMKKLVGGGTMSIVNQTVPRALKRLGYTPEQTAEIIAHIDEQKSIIGAPHLAAEHLPVFACSMGDNTIHYMGHVKMMGAIQPWISGALSKTCNVPESTTVEEIEQLHIEAWKLGVKAIAIYRDNCKVAQPLAMAKKDTGTPAVIEGADTDLAKKVVELEKALEIQTVVVKQPVRERLPKRRHSATTKFRVADCEGYVTVGEYDDGRPGEVFMKVSKQGSTLSGIMDAFSISVSLGLQHGVPLRTFVEKYTNMRFEPAGMTDDAELRIASSILDYIFRRLAVDYLSREEREELGILTTDERMQPTLPGVEEEATESVGVVVAERPAASHPKPAAPESDAPFCMQCGVQMQRSGSCHACPSCGTTSGCS